MPKATFYELYHLPKPTLDEQRKAQQQRFVNQLEPAPVSQADTDRAVTALDRGMRGVRVGQQLRMPRNH